MVNINCQYEQLKYPLFLGDLSGQTSVEATLDLPESLPRIGKIIAGDFQTGPVTFKVAEDLIVINGKLYPHLLFMAELAEERKKLYHHSEEQYQDQDEENIRQETEEYSLPQEYGVDWYGENGIDYEARMEAPGIRTDMLVQVEVKPLRGIFEKQTPDRAVFKGSVKLIVHAVQHQTTGIISDINVQIPATISLVKDSLVVEEILETKKFTLPVRSNLTLSNLKPGIARILEVSAIPIGINQEIAKGKLFMKGAIELSLVYVGSDDEGNPTEIFSHDWNQATGSVMPFETHIDLNNTDGEVLALARVTPRNVQIELGTPHDLHCQLDLDIEVNLTQIHQQELVIDAILGENELMDSKKYLVNLEEYSGETNGQLDLEQQIELPGNNAGIERILSCSGMIEEVTVEAAEGKALVEGSLNLRVAYISEGDLERKLHIATWSQGTGNGIPLAGVLEFSGLQSGTLLRTQPVLESIKVELIDDRAIKLNGTVQFRILARTPRALFVMQDCAIVVPVEEATRPSMLFYVIQADDTLWKIARHYQTTMETLLKANTITNPDNIVIGQKLVIPKKIMNS
jgi:hypothetical protein